MTLVDLDGNMARFPGTLLSMTLSIDPPWKVAGHCVMTCSQRPEGSKKEPEYPPSGFVVLLILARLWLLADM